MDVDTHRTPKGKKGSSSSSPASEKSQVRRKLEMSSISSPTKKKGKKIKSEKPTKDDKNEEHGLLSIHSIQWKLKTGIDTALEILCPDVDTSELDITQKVNMVLDQYTPKQTMGAFCDIAKDIGVDLSRYDLDKSFMTRARSIKTMTECLVNYWNANDQEDTNR